MNRKTILTIILTTVLGTGFFLVSTTSAQTRRTVDSAKELLDQAVQPTGIRTDSVQSISGSVIERALQLVGLAFLILMVYGGITWLTARGNEEMVTKAKKTVTGAIVGLVLVVAAYGITYFVSNAVINAPTDPAGLKD